MKFDEYCLHYDSFHAEFDPAATPDDRLNKLQSETIELLAAIKFGGRSERLEEAADVMNTAIAYLRSEGIDNPLDYGYVKLQKTADKYRNAYAD